MCKKKVNINKVSICGKVTDIEFSHNVRGIDFMQAKLAVKKRDGRSTDIIPIKFNASLMNGMDFNKTVQVEGTIARYYNKSGVQLYVKAKSFSECDADVFTNRTTVLGMICGHNEDIELKFDKKVTADISVINDSVGEIPAVAYNSNAMVANAVSNLKTTAKLTGDLHSKETGELILVAREIAFSE